MTEGSVPRLVLSLAVPSMVSMVVTALYNVVDAAFVGRLSTEATAGIGIGFAYMAFIQAVGFFFGHGSGNYISRALGAQRYGQAGVMASTGFFTPLLLGMMAALVGLPLLPELVRLLGAPPDVVPYGCKYLRYILMASPFMMSALTLNNQLRLQGNARFGMVGIVSGALLNIVLDPLLIFVFRMGVSGASLATAISQFAAWGLLLWGTMRDGSVHISLSQFRPSLHVYKEITAGGLPSLCRQAFNCLSAVMLNYAAARYAPEGHEASAVAAFAVVSRTTMFAFSLILGFLQGFQPVCGFNYGAHKYGRVLQSYLFAYSVSTAMLIVLSALGYIFAPQIIALFRREDPMLIAIGSRALRWQCLAFPLVTLSTATNMLFQNIRMPLRSTLLSISRQGLFFIPAVLVLPRLLGIHGVELTQPVADLCTFLLSIPFAVWIVRRLRASQFSPDAERHHRQQ
ncbi:MAG: MATE family efflux transporter [Bacteroidaceae bacterium]|nr:MATE family efflux transporter [Bacteroidales bacterium]MBR0272586.1 MATE family efflux transporter [Bacteroidaceae bacterium]